MDEDDPGYFEYDPLVPPLCLKGEITPMDEEQRQQCVEETVKYYLKESNHFGLKNPNALLPSGLVAGEAAIYHLRRQTQKRKLEVIPNESETLVPHAGYEELMRLIQLYIHDVSREFTQDPTNQVVLRQCIPWEIFQQNQTRKMIPALKEFMTKTLLPYYRGYTKDLHRVINDMKAWCHVSSS